MKKITYLLIPSSLLAIFIIWTILVKVVDSHYIQDIGFLGFYTLNTSINNFVQSLQTDTFVLITNILMILAILTVVPFAAMGVVQLVVRKSLKKVDYILYCLLFAYFLMAVAYVAFEIVKINFSPLSTAEELKASYPSSHILITVVLLGVAVSGLMHYVSMNKVVKIGVNCLFVVLAILAVVFRLFSGHHYFTDVIGGVLLSATIISCYISLKKYLENKEPENN